MVSAHSLPLRPAPASAGLPALYLYADADDLPRLVKWLAGRCEIAAADIDGVLADEDDMACRPAAADLGLAVVSLELSAASLGEADVVLVAGAQFERRLDRLYRLGIRGLYDGNALLEHGSPAEQLARLAARHFVGPTPAVHRDSGHPEALRFWRRPLVAGAVPASTLFLVNSLPKAGSIWLCSMLEEVLGVRTREQIIISHVADIEGDWHKPNNHGAVLLLRDLRDVVVSWFHHSARSDRQVGFATPRYSNLESFYWEFFLGSIRGSHRYYHGDLESWIDRMGANYVPILTFERLCADTRGELTRLLNAWRIDCPPAAIAAAIEACRFEALRDRPQERAGYIGTMIERDHLRKGQPGAWRAELPSAVARDIETRFAGYQQRLRRIAGLSDEE